MVRDLTLSLPAGHIGCLLGESGCGKTTVLRAIAGFEPLRAGRILLDGTIISTPDMQVAPESRRVGMMFQDYALFPHLTVAQNVAFGLRRLDRAARARRVEEMLELVGLNHAAASYPHEISGGQQQRVALAGAGALARAAAAGRAFLQPGRGHARAAGLRGARDPEGHRPHRHPGHAQSGRGLRHRRPHRRDEQGRIAQWDTPYNLHHHPADAFVRDFIRSEALEEQREQVFARGR